MILFFFVRPLTSIIAINVKYYRSILHISQEVLAEKAGLSSGMIGKVEAQLANPSLKTLERLAKALGVDSYQLLIDPDRQTGETHKDIDSFVSDFRLFLEHKRDNTGE